MSSSQRAWAASVGLPCLERRDEVRPIAARQGLVLDRPAERQHGAAAQDVDREVGTGPAEASEDGCVGLVREGGRALEHEGDGRFERPAGVALDHHPGDALDLGVVVAAVSALESLGPGEAEPLLPRPQHGDADPGSGRQPRRW